MVGWCAIMGISGGCDVVIWAGRREKGPIDDYWSAYNDTVAPLLAVWKGKDERQRKETAAGGLFSSIFLLPGCMYLA